MPAESELDTSAREPLATKAADPGKGTSRAYNWTLFVSITALLISIGSFGIMLAASHRLAGEAQSAALESEITVNRSLADFGQPSGNDKPISFLFSLTLRNAGNTPATQVKLKWIESLIDANSSPIRPSDEHNLPVSNLNRHQEENLPLVIEMTSEEFRRFFRHGRAQLKITGEVKYKDTSNRDHALNWTAVLNGDSVLTVRQ